MTWCVPAYALRSSRKNQPKMQFRSILFVPGDRPERFIKAMNSAADALILDLEDSVSPSQKVIAREAITAYLAQKHPKPVFVRVNPLGSEFFTDDLEALKPNRPDGIMLPKAEGAKHIQKLVDLLDGDLVPILPIASETPKSLFAMGSYGEVTKYLCGLTWGAEDLPAAIGASTARLADGSYTAPIEWVRSQALFAAHAAGVDAIETVFPNIKDETGLAEYAKRGRRDGFHGMMAIHPAQCPIINAAFTPSDEELSWAKTIVEAFAQNPEAGVLKLDGKMIDAPHLKQAQKILTRFQT